MYFDIAIAVFVALEAANVCILYLAPDSRLGNGVAVFNPWFAAKEDEAMALFVRYMVNWVAGTKLIFIALLLVILFTGTQITKLAAALAMIASIATYYLGLHPIIKRLDSMGQVTPSGYSRTLFAMITAFQAMFAAVAIAGLLIG
ncbi:MAG: hypothetical protein SOU51_01415 [Collinsella sp.]|nr:hypothetical protein [Collinsella sp.]